MKVYSNKATSTPMIIVHVSHLDYESGWFPKLVSYLEEEGFSQYLFLKKSSRYVSQEHTPTRGRSPSLEELGKLEASSRLFLLLMKLLIRKLRGQRILFLAQGHKESILCYLINRFFRLNYGIVHHMQPEFFDLYKKKFFFKGKIHNVVYRLYIRKAKYVQSLSLKVDKKLLENGVDDKKIFRCPPGIDFSEVLAKLTLSKIYSTESDETFSIVMVGRLSWEKNISLALHTFSRIVRRDNRFRLFIFGDGPLRNQLKEEIQELKLEDFVYLKGFSSNVLLHIRSAGCLLHTSLTESYGQVLVEAALMGVPVICTDVGIARELEMREDLGFEVLPEMSEESLWNALVSIRNTSSHKRLRDFKSTGLEKHDIPNVFRFMSTNFSQLELT